jgi:hypothetical protein
MARFGNKDGPRESEVLDRLGPGYFGCSPAELEEDISWARFSEQRNEVLPVHLDFAGRPFVVFCSHVRGLSQRFYFDDYGCALYGDVFACKEIGGPCFVQTVLPVEPSRN